ncbi:uncharacterized protein LOC130216498 isoform X2 [Danio aesculapii]|uniref:uncharacterized protein LOC130216498 isoform X2 n=1 Tax=Danio aesculapii TaxID=1142201 RepID=UPI0024BFAB76|nr:uncharacterized protein LOC130216498 isoform X2 [Danio aesculapii]
MKNILEIILFLLPTYGVFAADEVQILPVKKGNYVTLKPHHTQIDNINVIQWIFEDLIIAKLAGNYTSYNNETEIFRDILMLENQNGSLTIKNLTTNHTGLYKAEINHRTSYTLFNVTVYSVFGAEINVSVSVIEGQTVTLNTNFTDMKRIIRMRWFKNKSFLIAISNGSEITRDKFKDGLELNNQTGSLTIMDIKTTDTGVYKAEINHHYGTSEWLFNVTVNGFLSADNTLCGIFNTRPVELHEVEIPEQQSLKNEEKIVSVKKGQSVTLKPDAVIQRDDQILWTFGPEETVIAEVNTREISTGDGADGRFRDRLTLDSMTGSVTITNTASEHVGVYKLKIISSTGTSCQTFILTLIHEAKMMSVKEGESVTLRPDAVIQRNDQILWTFGPQETRISEVNTREISKGDGAEGRCRDRLKLDPTTGSVTITNTASEHVGVYKLKVISSTGTSYQTFILTLTYEARMLSVKEGESVTLKPDAVIQRDDQILWTFGPQETHINEVDTREISKGDGADGRFRDRLMLDSMMGSLTIRNATSKHVGDYKLKIISSTGTSYQTFILTLTYEARMMSVKEGQSVTLKPDAVIQRNDQILWTFGPQETRINEFNTREISTGDGADGRFRDKLRLDATTGSITITNTTSKYVGVYKLKIISNTGTSYQTFIFTLIQDGILVTEGSSVTLNPDTEIQKGDLILWMFGEDDSQIKIAEMKKTFDGPDAIFTNRLISDKKTGSLTIKDIKEYHAGLYKLQISNSSRATTNKTFKVLVNFEKVSVMEGNPVTLKVHVEIDKKDEIQWLYEEENTLIAEMKRRGRDKNYVGGGRFKDRLMVDDKTGSLTIKNTRPDHAGLYTLKINSSKGTSYKHFSMFVRARMILEKEGNNITLNVQAELQRDDLILWMFEDENNLIAQMNGETKETTFTEDERFRNKLLLDEKTGSLTIRNARNEHSGAYKLHIVSSKKSTHSTFRIFVCDYSDPNTVSVTAEESLILITNFNVERDDQLQWTFEGVTLASGMNGDVSKTSYGDDERFRGRLELHHQTASLTVKNTRRYHSGVYQLKLWNRHKKNVCLKVNVTVSGG